MSCRPSAGKLIGEINNQRKSRLVFEEGETGVPGEKPLGSEKRTNKLNPHMTPSLESNPGPHWWEASALTTAPSLHHQMKC